MEAWAENTKALFNSISTPYGLFNAKTRFIYKYLIVIILYFPCSIASFFKLWYFLFVNFHLHSYMILFQSITNNLNTIVWFWLIGLMGTVFTNGLGDLVSIPGRVTPKTLKMVLDTSLINTRHSKVCIKDKVEQSWERSSAFPYSSV